MWTFLRRRLRRHPRTTRSSLRPCLEALEDRLVLWANGPITAMIPLHNYLGMQYADGGGRPPDTNMAAGPKYLVEVVNYTVAIYNKSTGDMVSHQSLYPFFAPFWLTTDFVYDPVVTYDEQAQRFVVAALEENDTTKTANLLVAVSNNSDPTAGFTEKQKINVKEVSGGQPLWADNDKIGWNTDAYVFTMNMFPFPAGTDADPDHLQVVTLKKSTLTTYQVDRPNDVSMIPAVMHGAKPGDPMWFVEADRGGSNQVQVVKMTNVLSATPTFTSTSLGVDPYLYLVSASQPGWGLLDTNDCRILNVEWRDGNLVAAHTVRPANLLQAQARWYEFDTSGATVTLVQQGTISPSTDPQHPIHTWCPSIAIRPGGDLAMTYLQSSSHEDMSMYVTGRRATDPLGWMLPGTRVIAGQAAYSDPYVPNPTDGTPPVYRTGDYSSVTVDPVDNSFWAANEYATSPPGPNWGTWFSNFTIEGVYPQPSFWPPFGATTWPVKPDDLIQPSAPPLDTHRTAAGQSAALPAALPPGALVAGGTPQGHGPAQTHPLLTARAVTAHSDLVFPLVPPGLGFEDTRAFGTSHAGGTPASFHDSAAGDALSASGSRLEVDGFQGHAATSHAEVGFGDVTAKKTGKTAAHRDHFPDHPFHFEDPGQEV
jgi:hypothetical protein